MTISHKPNTNLIRCNFQLLASISIVSIKIQSRKLLRGNPLLLSRSVQDLFSALFLFTQFSTNLFLSILFSPLTIWTKRVYRREEIDGSIGTKVSRGRQVPPQIQDTKDEGMTVVGFTTTNNSQSWKSAIGIDFFPVFLSSKGIHHFSAV